MHSSRVAGKNKKKLGKVLLLFYVDLADEKIRKKNADLCLLEKVWDTN